MAAKRAVAVVGGGFSGTMAAVALARAGAETVLVDDRSRPAAGAAYSTPDPAHLLNVRARNMSAFPDAPGHFLAWVESEGLGDAETFVPRRAYREYLGHILEEAMATGRVRLVHGKAVASDPEALLLAGGERIGCGQIILAGGNYPSRLPAPFAAAAAGGLAIQDPWSAQGAEQLAALVAQEGDVLLVGTGLTMVDICLSLSRAGFAGRMIATSRRGLVPRGHDDIGVPPLPAPAPAPAGLAALTREVRKMARQGGWRPAVDSLRPVTAAVWQGLDAEERRRFLRHLRPWWDVHRHRIAPAVAARIAALREDGQLHILAGRVSQVVQSRGGKALDVSIAARGGGSARYTVAGAINCTGPEGAIARVRDPLIQELLGKGEARPDPLGLGLDVDAHSRVIGADGRPSERLSALGPLTRGTFWEIVAVPDIRSQAQNVACRVAASG